MPPASHTMHCTDSRKAQASGASARARGLASRRLRLKATAAPQAPVTAMGSHRKAARAESKRHRASNRFSSTSAGDRPRQISPAAAPAISRPLRKRRMRSVPSTYTATARASTNRQALVNDVESDIPKMTSSSPAKAIAVPHCRQNGPASLRSTATPAAHSTSPATSAPSCVLTIWDKPMNSSSSSVASQALRPSRHCTYQGASAAGVAGGVTWATGSPAGAGSTGLPAEALAGSASAAGAAVLPSAASPRSQRAAQTASAMSNAARGSAAQAPGSSRSSHSPTTRRETQITPAASMARMTRSRRTF